MLVETTPFVIPSSGSETFTWASAVLEVSRSPVSFRSCCSAWLVSSSPSANGRLLAETVKRMSVVDAWSRVSWNVPKSQVSLLAAALNVTVGMIREIFEYVSVGPNFHSPDAGATAVEPPPAKVRPCATKIGSGRKSVIL